LRLLTADDTARTLAWRNQDRVRTAFVTSSIIPEATHRAWFAAYAERDDDFVFVIEERPGGRPVGQISLYGIDWTAGTATFGRLLLGELDAVGKGLASEATGLVVALARRLGLRELRLEVFRDNRRAVALYRKHGFEPSGVQGDLLLMKRDVRPRHSVIVTGRERLFPCREAVASVLEQTVQDFELIVSDDGWDDDTRAPVRSLTEGDPRCRVVRRIDEAIGALPGDLVHYLTAEGRFAGRRFEIFDALFADPAVVVGYGRLACVDADGRFTGRTRYHDAGSVLDPGQLAHRTRAFERLPRWTDGDGVEFVTALSRRWPLYGIDEIVAFRRLGSVKPGTRAAGARGGPS
jgi:RimJ/RimL family protein N-acetyltransferase